MNSGVFLAGDAYQDGWFGHVNEKIFQSQFAQGLENQIADFFPSETTLNIISEQLQNDDADYFHRTRAGYAVRYS